MYHFKNLYFQILKKKTFETQQSSKNIIYVIPKQK